jgi:hypothetical protein
VLKCDDDDDGADDDDDNDNDEHHIQRSKTRNQYTHVRYFQRPNLPYIKTSLQKKGTFSEIK